MSNYGMDTYGRQPLDFATRNELVAFVAAGGLTGLWQGRTVSAQGIEYLVQPGDTSIPDLLGLKLNSSESGSNGNGNYVRFADGTQICWRDGLNTANANTASGSLFRSSSNVTWTFPIAFSAVPSVMCDSDNADCWATLASAPTTTNVAIRTFSSITQASPVPVRAMAVGRWF